MRIYKYKLLLVQIETTFRCVKSVAAETTHPFKRCHKGVLLQSEVLRSKIKGVMTVVCLPYPRGACLADTSVAVATGAVAGRGMVHMESSLMSTPWLAGVCVFNGYVLAHAPAATIVEASPGSRHSGLAAIEPTAGGRRTRGHRDTVPKIDYAGCLNVNGSLRMIMVYDVRCMNHVSLEPVKVEHVLCIPSMWT